jgi:hypothetical protein
VQFVDGQPEALAGWRRDPGKQRGRIVGVQPIERAPQTVVVEILGRDPRPEQVRHWLGLEELGDQIEAAIGAAQPVAEHRHRRGPHTDPFLRAGVARVQILGYSASPLSRHTPATIPTWSNRAISIPCAAMVGPPAEPPHAAQTPPPAASDLTSKNGPRHQPIVRNVGYMSFISQFGVTRIENSGSVNVISRKGPADGVRGGGGASLILQFAEARF